jgi:hypothetical protein
MSRVAAAALLLTMVLGAPAPTRAADEIDMSRVRALAELPVKDIFRDSPVHEVPRADYWKTIRESRTPVVVMFYSNKDPESQRLATLIRYVAQRYAGKFTTYGVMVVDSGKPPKPTAVDFEKSFSLDKTPGVLFYDNDQGKLTTECAATSTRTFAT